MPLSTRTQTLILGALGDIEAQTEFLNFIGASDGGDLTGLTGDVAASGPGNAAATVNSVGGSSAASVHSASLLANAATSANTANSLVLRGTGGSFSAGTITASLTGHASLDLPLTGGTLTGNLSLGTNQLTANVVSGGTLEVGNSVPASVGPGSIVASIQIFNQSGVSLGYIPVYSSIT